MQKEKNKNFISLFIGLLSVSFLLAQSASAATPTISNVTGTVATGQTLTISGANMMDENNENWVNFGGSPYNFPNFKGSSYGFEGSAPYGAGGDGYWDGNPQPNGGVYVTETKLSGNQSIKFDVGGDSCPSGQGKCGDGTCSDSCTPLIGYVGSSNPFYANISGHFFLRYYVRYNNTSGIWPDIAMKQIMFGGGGQGMYVQPSANGGNAPVNYEVSYGNNPKGGTIPGGSVQNNRWYLVEIEVDSSQDPKPIKVWLDNQLIINTTQTSWNMPGNLEFGIPNCFSTPSNFAMDEWWDNFTISTSRIYPSSLIEIGNSSNYATATKVYQEPLYLSDGSVQVKADLTGLGGGPYYLFVTNNRQETSTTYNLSGSSDTTPPSAPQGLSVI